MGCESDGVRVCARGTEGGEIRPFKSLLHIAPPAQSRPLGAARGHYRCIWNEDTAAAHGSEAVETKEAQSKGAVGRSDIALVEIQRSVVTHSRTRQQGLSANDNEAFEEEQVGETRASNDLQKHIQIAPREFEEEEDKHK